VTICEMGVGICRATGLNGYRGQVGGWTWWFGLFLGGLLVAAGIAETVRLVRSGDGGLVFWFGTLVGGGIWGHTRWQKLVLVDWQRDVFMCDE